MQLCLHGCFLSMQNWITRVQKLSVDNCNCRNTSTAACQLSPSAIVYEKKILWVSISLVLPSFQGAMLKMYRVFI